MLVRVTRRIVEAVVLLLAVGTIVFFLEHAVPGDPAVAILGGAASHPTKEAVAAVTAQYGFDRPLLAQYGDFLAGLVRLDFGESYTLKQSVTSVVAGQIGPTLALTVTALVLAWLLSITSTLLSAGRPGLRGRIGSVLETVAAGLPQFWLGLVLLLVFAVQLHWFPVIGSGPLGIVLPALTLAIPLAGFLGQVTRDSLLDAAATPFALSARARGEGPSGLFVRHLLRHAALPGLALSGWAFGSLLSGAVVVESVFARPGLGRTLLGAVTLRDIPLVTGVALVSALAYVVVVALGDLAERMVDPRGRAA